MGVVYYDCDCDDDDDDDGEDDRKRMLRGGICYNADDGAGPVTGHGRDYYD